jgi:hypothetical protein
VPTGAGDASGGAATGRIFGIGTARPVGIGGATLPVVANEAKTAGRRRGSGTRPLIGRGGGSASVAAVSVAAVSVAAVSATAAGGVTSSVAAKAMAAGRRRGIGMRPLMGWGGGSASVDAVSVIASGGCSAPKLGGPPALGFGHAGAAAGAGGDVAEPLVARRATKPAGLATVGMPPASGDAIAGAGGLGA